jgi:hypothetical protein
MSISFIEMWFRYWYKATMDDKEKQETPKVCEDRRSYNTTLKIDLLRGLRVRAAMLDRRQNDLLEEAIKDLLMKYDKQIE